MFDSIFILFILLFVKHWYIDFVNQSMDEVHGKGIYGNWIGLGHSIKHGLATTVIFFAAVWDFQLAVMIGFADFFIHYHTDWAKININKKYNYTVENPKFWMWLGLDQLVHSLTYVFLVWYCI